MRQLLILGLWLLSFTACAAQVIPVEAAVYFSPGGGVQEAVVSEINKAKKDIRVQAYSFTNPQIAKSLVDASRRGVNVLVILDKSHLTQRYTEADFLGNQGVKVYIDATHSIAHNKIIVLDGKTVITGSYNFTKAAENSNAENLLVIQSPRLAEIYLTNWDYHLKHSTPFFGSMRRGAR